MATIATCPQCASQLSLPTTARHTDRAQCPKCDAEFWLSDAVQVLLPAARILDPVDAPSDLSAPPVEMPAADSVDADVPSTTLATLATDLETPRDSPAPSWESPLKKAIAVDISETTGKNDLATSPQFDFEVDAPPPEEPAAAEFAAPALDSDATAEISLRAAPARRAGRRILFLGLIGLSASLVGILLGFYALLWLQGRSADYLHLARLLPPAMLPAATKPLPPADLLTALAETQPQPNDLSASEPAETLAAEDPTALRRDDAVAPAAAYAEAIPTPKKVGITPEEFGRLLAAARETAPDILEGDLSTRASISRKGRAYTALCQLAEHFDFVDQPGLDPDTQTQASLAKGLYRIVTDDAKTRRDLAHIAAQWWQYDRRPNEGILLAGRIEQLQAVGQQTLGTVVVGDPEAGLPIPVLLAAGTYSVGEQIGVVGRIVANPRDSIQGYDGDAEPIVAAQYSYRLDAEPAASPKQR